MRILYVFNSLAVWGGVERILVDKMNSLVKMYHDDVYIITTDQGRHPIPYYLEPEVLVEDLNISFHSQYHFHGVQRLIFLKKNMNLFEELLTERINCYDPDVIVCTTAYYVHSLVKVKRNIPLVVESHSIYSYTICGKGFFKQIWEWLLKKNLKKADVIVALTEADANTWSKYYPHVITIPNMVHLNETGKFSDNMQQKVLFVGRFDYQKRVSEIIEIWRMLQAKFPNWELHIYGDGILREELQNNVHEHMDNIIIHKPTSAIFDCYVNSAFLVMTSLFEPFGLVMPEAMSCGLPVIAYDVPYGPASIITDGRDGFLIKDNDRRAFAEKMALLMNNLELRQQMGKLAILSAQRYSAERIMPIWNKLFRKLVVQRIHE